MRCFSASAWIGDSVKKLRYLCVFVLCASLLTAFAPLSQAAVFHSDVRVLISIGKPESTEIRITGSYYIREFPDVSVPEGKLTVSMSGRRPSVTLEDKEYTAASLTFVSREYGALTSYIRVRNTKYSTCAYLGNMTFDVSEGGLRAINTLPVEQYLYGVVPYEMSNTFPTEALKAQAICARGYAIAKCSANASKAYDLGDTSSDQVYHGLVSKYTRAISAVNATRGKVLTYEGDIIEAFYSASNGGQTEKTGNVWSNDLPYYTQRFDPFDLENRSSLEEVSLIPDVFDEASVAQMDKLVLDKLQTAADAAAGEHVTLVSTVYANAYAPKYDAPSICYTKADVTLNVKNDSGSIDGQLTVTLELDDLLHSDENYYGMFNGDRTLRLRGVEHGEYEAKDETKYSGWLITNRRYGHGVGLSQRGAQQRATAGQDCGEMLDFYYVDTKLFTLGSFEEMPALTSERYDVTAQSISGVSAGSSVDKLLSRLSSDGGTLSLVSSRGKQKTEGDVATGDNVRTSYGEATFFDIPVVIAGDVSGDGVLTEDDITALQAHLSGAKRLTGAYLSAADYNGDGTVDIKDLLKLIIKLAD